jgi:hypothetical protein
MRNILISAVVLLLITVIVLTICLAKLIARGQANHGPVYVSKMQLFPPPIGLLGKRLGAKIVIEGKMATRVLLSNPIAVERVDGNPLSHPLALTVLRFTLQPTVTYRFEGYETGSFEGPPQWLRPHAQQPFQYYSEFIVTRILEPATAKLDENH